METHWRMIFFSFAGEIPVPILRGSVRPSSMDTYSQKPKKKVIN